MLNYDVVKNWPFKEVHHALAARDTMLYALSVGMGADPMDRAQLRFVCETGLMAMPSMASVLCQPGAWMLDPRSGIDFSRLVAGEQDITIHRPLPVQGELNARARVTRVLDKGPGKGAVIEQVRDVFGPEGDLLASIRQSIIARGDGGYSQQAGHSDEPPVPLPAVPERAPDREVGLASIPQAALVHRLLGDYNPLHSDPDVAARAGFSRPILHGLCTFGMATHAVLRTVCGYDAARLKRLAMRFSSPVFPGEKISFQIWDAANGCFHLRARVEERGVTVVNNGWFELASTPASRLRGRAG